jgi:hypothetical protein
MKPFTELTADDFVAYRTWRHLGGADATAIVEPQLFSEISEDDAAVYLAATDFTFSDGTASAGFCSPADDSGLDYVQPVIFGPHGQVPLWRPELGAAASKIIARELGKTVTQVFPLAWHSKVLVDGEVRNGRIAEADLKAGPR